MDVQLNIQNGAFYSINYQENADDDRTSYSAVCGSNGSRKNAFSLGFTRARILQSFPFHCHTLHHLAIQGDVQELKMGLILTSF